MRYVCVIAAVCVAYVYVVHVGSFQSVSWKFDFWIFTFFYFKFGLRVCCLQIFFDFQYFNGSTSGPCPRTATKIKKLKKTHGFSNSIVLGFSLKIVVCLSLALKIDFEDPLGTCIKSLEKRGRER